LRHQHRVCAATSFSNNRLSGIIRHALKTSAEASR
jgi:hypothetical protein